MRGDAVYILVVDFSEDIWASSPSGVSISTVAPVIESRTLLTRAR